MLSVPSRVASSYVSASDGSSSSSPQFFCKDGRKITVGDCALFKPSQDSPPFIGIVRRISVSKEDDINLDVTWFYRPVDVKLGKGIAFEAAPNEIFYSFHRDTTPAASLLHPCKVAFLPKGVELPSGIPSYVCRRVYDISNKRLWWLTDQDYINERQEEVNQLLNKTNIEMHATVQNGGRSPKPVNGSTSTSQIKPSSDSIYTSPSFPSQNKGKKRDRGDQGFEPVKRERSSRSEDGDPGCARSENSLKMKITKITERGGLVDSEGVEKLVQLMMPERNDKRIDLASRLLLAGVVAATVKADCLSRFVHSRGLPMFDEWLQEAHKGKINDGGGPKPSDKALEEFLLVLLHALDKLPVNLQALQTCNIGKSVNHLRTHKSMEIQRKARSLVDTWKRRVEAEMNMNDTRSVSNQAVPWSGKSRVSGVSNARSRHSGGTSETTPESSTSQISASRSASTKPVQMETAESVAAPGVMKAVPPLGSSGSNLRDGHPRNVSSSDLTLTASRDEKSTSSSQSHNNSHSCSSDHAKTGGILGRDDAGSSTDVSNKVISPSTRQKRSTNGVHKQGCLSRNPSLPKVERVSPVGSMCGKVFDVSAEGNTQKLIVKIPNRVHNPVHNGNEGSFEDPSMLNGRAPSPPVSPEMANDCYRNELEKTEACGANISSGVKTESWQSNDLKHMPTGSDIGDESLGIMPDDLGSGEEPNNNMAGKSAPTTPLKEVKSEKLCDDSLRSINALIDSCVKLSETLNDDGAMDLLASVAAGEMLSSERVSPANFSHRSMTTSAHAAADEGPMVRSSPCEGCAEDKCKSADNHSHFHEKAGVDDGIAKKNGHEYLNTSCRELQQTSEWCSKTKGGPASTDYTIDEAKVREPVSVILSEADKETRKDITGDSGGHVLIQQDSTLLNSGENTEKISKLETVVTEAEKVDEMGQNHSHLLKQDTDGSRSQEFLAEASSCSEFSHHRGECVEENLMNREVPDDGTASAKSDCYEVRGSGEGQYTSHSANGDALCALGSSSRSVRLEFDLNEGINADDEKLSEATTLDESSPAAMTVSRSLSYPPTESASVTVTAAVRGPFVPPDDLLRTKGELSWKGSATTSAFRPAEFSRKVVEMPSGPKENPRTPDPTLDKQTRAPLDFDLNIADEGLLEDVASDIVLQDPQPSSRIGCAAGPVGASAYSRSGGLDLDLNQDSEATEIVSTAATNEHRLHDMVGSAKSPSGSGVVFRNFDLNDGPSLDDGSLETSTSGQHVRNDSIYPQCYTPGLRPNISPDVGNLSTWYAPVGTYSALGVQSLQPKVAIGGPPRMLDPSRFSTDVFPRPVLPSPAVPFGSTFQYPVFPFGTSFSLPSLNSTTYIDPVSGGKLSFPPMNSQMLGPAGAVSTHYSRPCVVQTFPPNNGGFDRRWGRQGLDLNTGPGLPDVEGKEGFSVLVPGQLAAANSQFIGRNN